MSRIPAWSPEAVADAKTHKKWLIQAYLQGRYAGDMAVGASQSLSDSAARAILHILHVESGLVEKSGAETMTEHIIMTEHIMQFFTYGHLPPHLAEVSQPFAEHARRIVETLPRNPERTVALRKLLEAKDAAVRALLAKAEP